VDLKCEKSMFFLIEHKLKKINTNKREKKRYTKREKIMINWNANQRCKQDKKNSNDYGLQHCTNLILTIQIKANVPNLSASWRAPKKQ
jgi:hypothetical protein